MELSRDEEDTIRALREGRAKVVPCEPPEDYVQSGQSVFALDEPKIGEHRTKGYPPVAASDATGMPAYTDDEYRTLIDPS